MKEARKFLLSLALSIPFVASAAGNLENPAGGVTESGIGIISGWHCSATRVEAIIDGVSWGYAYVGSERPDTVSACSGKSNNGFALLLNFNEMNRGSHNVKVYADGVQFGESNFNTIQSGGIGFLTNVSKQVVVNDFPKVGSSATLTWNQSKQSFVVTSISGSGSSNPPPTSPVGLAKLYGNVSLSYKFSSTSTIYADSFTYSASNIDSSGQLIGDVSNRNAGVGCALTKTSPEFLCVIADPFGNLDVFLFDVNATGSISGTYEYCIPPVSYDLCASDLVGSPDGTVSGTVSRARVSALSAKSAPEALDSSKSNSKVKQVGVENSDPAGVAVPSERVKSLGESINKIINP